MAVPERVYIPHVAADGSSKQHQRGQGQALSLLVGNNIMLLVRPKHDVKLTESWEAVFFFFQYRQGAL